MFCFKCGKKLPDNASFCNCCGTKIPTKLAEAPPINQNKAAENKNAAVPYVSTEKIQVEQPKNTYTTDTQSAQQTHSAPATKNGQKKSIVPLVVIGAIALVVVAAVIVFIIFFAGGKKDGDNGEHSSNTSNTTTTASEKETATTGDTNDAVELIDNVPAANGHYTTKDLAGYIGWTADKIRDAFGYVTPSLVSYNYYYNYDNMQFTIIDVGGVSEVKADADIVEFKGEALNKTYDELIKLLGTPIYTYSDRMGYIMNQAGYAPTHKKSCIICSLKTDTK